MDRRLPNESKRFRSATVASVVAWSLGMKILAAEGESATIPMPGSDVGVGASAGGWISLAVVVAGLAVAAVLWVRRRRRLVAGAPGGIQVIDRTPMGGGRALALVRVGDRVVLVGESAQGFQRLAEFAADDPAAASAQAIRRVAS